MQHIDVEILNLSLQLGVTIIQVARYSLLLKILRTVVNYHCFIFKKKKNKARVLTSVLDLIFLLLSAISSFNMHSPATSNQIYSACRPWVEVRAGFTPIPVHRGGFIKFNEFNHKSNLLEIEVRA